MVNVPISVIQVKFVKMVTVLIVIHAVGERGAQELASQPLMVVMIVQNVVKWLNFNPVNIADADMEFIAIMTHNALLQILVNPVKKGVWDLI
jgi:hypothetical protein